MPDCLNLSGPEILIGACDQQAQQAKAVSQTVMADEAQESSSEEEEDDSEDEAEQETLQGSAALGKSGQKPQQKAVSGKLVADANNADSSSSGESEEDDSSDDEAEADAQEGMGGKSAANRDPRLSQKQQTLVSPTRSNPPLQKTMIFSAPYSAILNQLSWIFLQPHNM